MASYHCEKCGRVFEVAEGATGAVCPKCATPVSQTADKRPELVTDPARQAEIYRQAVKMKTNAVAFGEWETAEKLLLSIGDYEDAPQLAAECRTLADKSRREAIYQQAKNRQGGTIDSLRGKAELMRSIAGYRDADTLAETYQQLADELAAQAEKSAQVRDEQQQVVRQALRQRDRRNRKVALICAAVGVVIVGVVLIISLVILPANQYDAALEKFNAGDYVGASQLFGDIAYYKDSADYLQKAFYHLGQDAMVHEDYVAAENYFSQAGSFEDAATQLIQVRGILYDKALKELENGEYTAAQASFDAAGDYEDAKAYKHFCRALRVWNGDETADASKMDLKKAEDIIWKVMDGLWYSEDSGKEITIRTASREETTPDLVIADNTTLQWTANGVTYTVEILSKTTFTLSAASGEYVGTYYKA